MSYLASLDCYLLTNAEAARLPSAQLKGLAIAGGRRGRS